ncbi:hypothetical protein EG850_08715 [Gulosibacter macacae]|uniref:Uncharacterized protein n=1 Tax=Gulosibacter macacae TaxID=2488791 RepID=A0A3P3VY69_9MICO|nr:hypothetical protein [Gulosibacter macacae]RRJ86419.1 hypothetical protein EG850_08715 [Gulosibacter macacae]
MIWLMSTPVETPTFDPAQVTPGPVGFFVTIGLFLAVGLIAMGLMNRMSRLQARYAVREQLEAEAAAGAAANEVPTAEAAGDEPKPDTASR